MVGSTLPSLMGDYTDDELNQLVIDNAVYFTVVQVTPGQFVRGGRNYARHQVDTLEEAQELAKTMFEADKKSCLIYGVANFAGANGFSRPIDSYPKTTYQSKADKSRAAKKEKEAARERARQARLSLGEKRIESANKAEVLESKDPAVWVD